MEPFPNVRELWAKAVQTPDQLTAEERRSVLRQADPAAQVANVFKVSGLTPEELQNKALTSPESMTFEECRLIRNGYHIWDPSEALGNSKIHWRSEDRTAHIKAHRALSWSEQTRRWGFVVFRDRATDGDSNIDSWEKFLELMDSCMDEGLRSMLGGTAIIPTKEFTLADGLASENNPEILRRSVHYLPLS